MPIRNSALVELQDEAEDARILNGTENDMFYDDEDLGFRYERYPKKKKTVSFQKQSFLCYVVFGVIIAVLIGVFIGRSTMATTKPSPVKKTSYNVEIRSAVMKELNSKYIRENLKKLTEKPHLAGSEQDEHHLVDMIKGRWESYLDEVKVFPYDVLLSFPNSTDKNYVGLIYKNGSITDKSNATEKPLTKHEKNPDVISAFNAYSPSGNVEGNMFYVNYGRIEDFEYLAKSNVNVSGGICIARYGKAFRGDKANHAQQYNCSGLVIYTDPFDYSGIPKHGWDLKTNADAYPDTWWLPPDGIQRGTIVLGGGPLTPDYPGLNLTYRLPWNKTNLPKIPVQPIGYQDAFHYLSILGGEEAPPDWQGGLNITYRFGGSFKSPHQHCKAVLHVANYMKRKTIHNVIGFIRGWLEPEKYVLFGNHRDAWTFGGADPSSGTAVLLEVSRAIAQVVKDKKWRPRRSIVFCSWAAEEYGLLGSTEWVEQMEKRLLLQAVAYINIDIAVEGNVTFRALSTPSLHQLIFNVTKSIPNPLYKEVQQGRPTVYDTWLKVFPDHDLPNRPNVRNIGSGSDYTYFIQKVGVSSMDFRYTYNNKDLSSYPVYHSLHDTFEYFDTFVDPDFNLSLAIGAISADSVLQLSASITLNLNPVDYATKLKLMAGGLQNEHGLHLAEQSITLHELNRTISIFEVSAVKLLKAAMSLNSSSSDMDVRRINDKLFYLERGFIDFNGLPGRHQYRHVVFAPSLHNSYSGGGFPGVSDALYNVEHQGGSWEMVKKELSILCLQILATAELMCNF